jgi:glycosyltransferase involved in cell wall biosynthesis
MHTLRLAQALVDRGAEVHVVTRIERGLVPFERMGGVRVHRVGATTARGPVASAAFVTSAVARLLALRTHVDVVHAHQLLSPATAALLASPLLGRPVILNPHACGGIGDVGVLSSSALGRLRLRAALERADALVAVSAAIRDELLEAGAPPQRIWSIANGVDTDRFAPAEEAEREALRAVLPMPPGPLVVYTGRLSPEKGVDVLLAAWPHLRRQVADARLWILGEGPEGVALRAQAHALRIEESVTFGGAVLDVAPYLRAATAAVLPSRTEGMPVALLEAMSCGLPVVATRVGGSAEVLLDGVTGRLVPPEEPARLASVLAELLLAPDAASRLGTAARARVLESYSIALAAERFLTLYRAVTSRLRAAPAAASTGSATR